ncbi:hypothetical protein [Allohahella sp. A8]|uniref:hypothetical protein n=1 Tax=Allohahella sp. A8 TaxID=3141461 RepID=UPI003A80708E
MGLRITVTERGDNFWFGAKLFAILTYVGIALAIPDDWLWAQWIMLAIFFSCVGYLLVFAPLYFLFLRIRWGVWFRDHPVFDDPERMIQLQISRLPRRHIEYFEKRYGVRVQKPDYSPEELE